MTDNIPNDIVFHDTKRRLTIEDDRAIIRRQQEIPDQFWDHLREIKAVQDSAPVGDFLMAASIPTNIVEQWYAEGFNIFSKEVTLPLILARLRLEDKEKLITTSRSI